MNTRPAARDEAIFSAWMIILGVINLVVWCGVIPAQLLGLLGALA